MWMGLATNETIDLIVRSEQHPQRYVQADL